MMFPKSLQTWLSSQPILLDADLSRLTQADFRRQTAKILITVFVLFTTYYVIPALYSFLFSPLKRVPGPFLARFSRWWEYRAVSKGDSNLEYIRLHRKHGPVVRVGPNRYSISQPQDVKIIYELGAKYSKTDYYKPLRHPNPDLQNIFTIEDNASHKERRRKISSLYSMSTMVSYESAVDKMTNVCLEKILQFSKEARLIEIPHFMQYYAFDVIGEITFNQSFGMMKHEGDTTGMIPSILQGNDFMGHIGVIPNLIPWVTALQSMFRRKFDPAILNDYTIHHIDEHREANKQSTKDTKKYDTFLKKVLDLEAEGRASMSNILDACGSNIGAGSDTTAITLSSALYYLFTNPERLNRLRQEIDTQAKEHLISDPVTFKEAQGMPYLQAVIKETLRMHPAVGTILARKVPKGGIQLSGYYFPEGTEIGANSWVLHYSKNIYGPDPEVFRPERWLEGEKTSMMESMMFAFGAGSRTCIGKNISLLEMTKTLPQIVRKFDIALEHPEKPMETICAWFVYPHYNGRFKVRGST